MTDLSGSGRSDRFAIRGDCCIEERIWGRRLYDEQSGVISLLELLCVFNAAPFPSGSPDAPSEASCRMHDYEIPKRSALRSLVFNNPYVDEGDAADPNAWETWRSRFSQDKGTTALMGGENWVASPERLEELRACFPGRESFQDFRRVIHFLRASGINRDTNRRWTSQFIFPWGRSCLYADLDNAGKPDRRFFARNGELLYLLLSHAQRREELGGLLREKLLDSGNPLDALCRRLTLSSGEKDVCRVPGWSQTSHAGALPWDPEHGIDFVTSSLRRVNILCEDLIAALTLPIQTPDVILIASRLISLNLLCYFLEQSSEALRRFGAEPAGAPKYAFLCEALQKRTSAVRRISQNRFKANETRSLDAVRAFYERYAEDGQARAAEDDDRPSAAQDDDEEEGASAASGSKPLSEVLDAHRCHWGAKLHRALAKDCGLASKLCARDYRYAPSDDLLETLAATLLHDEKRLLFSEFLARAYERYGLAFAESECRAAGFSAEELDGAELKANERRLMRRLSALGLVAWLSDGFEFVLNPYRA